MSHGLWTLAELESIKTDKWIATQFMNEITFSENEIKYYPYNQRKTYHAEWNDEPEFITIYATDERMLLKYIDKYYTRRPDYLVQVITQYRPIKMS